MENGQTHTHTETDRHYDSMTDPYQRAESVKRPWPSIFPRQSLCKYHATTLKSKDFWIKFMIYAVLSQFQVAFFPPLCLVKLYPSLPFPPFKTHVNLLSSTAMHRRLLGKDQKSTKNLEQFRNLAPLMSLKGPLLGPQGPQIVRESLPQIL